MQKVALLVIAAVVAAAPSVVAGQTPTPAASVTPTAAATSTMPGTTTTPLTATPQPGTPEPTPPLTPIPSGYMNVTARVEAAVGSDVVFDTLVDSTIVVCATAVTTGSLVFDASLLDAQLPPACGESTIDCVIFSAEFPGPCVRMTIDGQQYALFGFEAGASIDLGTLRAVIIVADIAAPETGMAGHNDADARIGVQYALLLALLGAVSAVIGYRRLGRPR